MGIKAVSGKEHTADPESFQSGISFRLVLLCRDVLFRKSPKSQTLAGFDKLLKVVKSCANPGFAFQILFIL